MFVVTEAEAAAIRAVYEQSGEFSAAVELRRGAMPVPTSESSCIEFQGDENREPPAGAPTPPPR